MDTYGLNDTASKLRLIRYLTLQARRELWDIDEAKTTDKHYANPQAVDHNQRGRMDDDVRIVQESIDDVIAHVAYMLDKLALD